MRRPTFWKAPSVYEQLTAEIEQAKADLRTARLEAVKAQSTVQWREAHLKALQAEFAPYEDRAKSA